MNELQYSVVKYNNYLTYSVWTPESEDDDYLYGPGAEISVLYPITEYLYANDFPSNGWERLHKYKKFRNQRGEVVGQGPDKSNTSPLFNIHYTLPVIFRAYSHKDYKALFTILMALALVDSKNIFGTEGIAGWELTPEMLNFLERTDRFWGSRSAEVHMKSNLTEVYDEDEWIVKLEKDKINTIPNNTVLQSKIEFKARIFYKKYSNRVSLDTYQQEEIGWPL
jgi:hypothetical protein